MYADIIAPTSPEELDTMSRKALSTGYSKLGVVEDVQSRPHTFKVALLSAEDVPTVARRIRGRYDLLVVKPNSLEEARKVTASRLVDAVMATYDSDRPNFDYVCARQLKRNEGALIIPVRHFLDRMKEDPHVLRSVRLELKIALKAGVYPIIASFASNSKEIVPPRLLISLGEFFFDMKRGQAKMAIKEFPHYLISPERKLKLKGVGIHEV